MPFVKRDHQGKITNVYHQYIEEGLEEVHHEDPELTGFLEGTAPDEQKRREMVESDLALSRVMEDLIEILIEKGVIYFTDFPAGAQKKLLGRRGMRKEFAYVDNLFGSTEDEQYIEDADDGESFL